MRAYLIALCVILCAVYTHSESRQYYPGVGYVSTGNVRPVTSSRLRAAPATRNSQQRARPARLREDYELLEREELAPTRRRSRPNYRTTNRRVSARRASPGRRYRLARNEATTVAPPPASEPAASPPAQPVASPVQPASSPSFPSDSSPVRAFGGIFPNFQAGGLGGVTGGGYAQTNGPGAAFAAGFAQSSGSNSFAGGFGAVINHPKFPKFGGGSQTTSNKDADLDNVSSKDDARSDDPGFDDPIDDSEEWFNKTSAYVYDLSSTVMTIKNWTEYVEFADIAANLTNHVTDQITIVPLKAMMSNNWRKSSNNKRSFPGTLVFVMASNGQGSGEGMMIGATSKKLTSPTIFGAIEPPPTFTVTSTSTSSSIPTTTPTTVISMDKKVDQYSIRRRE